LPALQGRGGKKFLLPWREKVGMRGLTKTGLAHTIAGLAWAQKFSGFLSVTALIFVFYSPIFAEGKRAKPLCFTALKESFFRALKFR
jgi:hypothetical protein